ncbi:hypothetical protein D3C77_346190 [compost metagenome]
MGRFQHALPERRFFRLLWLERIKEGLVLTRGVGTALDTKLLHGADKAVTGSRNADGADQTGLVGVDLVRGTGDVVSAGGAQIADHRVQLDLRVLGAQATYLVVDVTRLHRATTRTVDTQDHRLGFRILERFAQATDDVIGTGRLLIGNHPAHFNQRSVTDASRSGLVDIHQGTEQRENAKQIGEGQQLEEDPPAPRTTLLLHTCQEGFLQKFPAFLLFVAFGARRLPLVSHAHLPWNYRGRRPAQPGLQM